MEWLEHFIVDVIGTYGYLAIFVLMTLESALIPIPSEVTMVFGGFLVARGDLDFVLVGLLGAFANLVGSWIAYYIGVVGGRPLVERWGKYVFLRAHELDRAEAWWARRGDVAVFVGRLLPVVRTFISLPAGIARMPMGKFSFYTFLGCLPWSFALAWAGLLLGENWEAFVRNSQPVVIGFGVVVLALGVWWLLRRRARARAKGEVPEEVEDRG